MSLRRAFVTYTLGRLGLFLLTALLIFSGFGLAGSSINGAPLVLLALIGSSILSFVLLRDQRDRFAQALAEQRAAKTAAVEARRARLDS